MIDELYIDGVKVDMGASSNIFLNYRSNIFNDLNNIVSNYSNTISLPNTSRNKAIIDRCLYVGSTTDYPYRYHRADVYRDGVPLVIGATLIISSVSHDKIDVLLTWGVSDEIKSLVSTSDTLQDLDYAYTENHGEIIWQTTGLRQTPMADYGIRYDDTSLASHPVCEVSDVLTAIENKYNVQFAYDETPWDSWCIPLLQRNAEKATGTYGLAIHGAGDGIVGGLNVTEGKFTFVSLAMNTHGINNPHFDNKFYAFATLTDEGDQDLLRTNFALPKRKGVTQAPKGSITMQVNATTINEAASITFVLLTYAGESVNILLEQRQYKAPTGKGIGVFEIYFELDGSESSASTLGEGVFEDGCFTTYAIRGNGTIKSIDPTSSLTVTYSQDLVYLKGAKANPNSEYFNTLAWYQASINTYGGEDGVFPVAPNMPKMKVIDFLKDILKMSGQYAYINEYGYIQFASYSLLYSNITASNIYDWSLYLKEQKNWLNSKLEFKIDKEAQKNIAKYKDSDDGKGQEMNSYFLINNLTLDESTDAITLSFVGYSNKGSYASIILYDYEYETIEDEDGSAHVEISKTNFNRNDKPYITRLVQGRNGVANSWYITGELMDWANLLEDGYGWIVEEETYETGSYMSIVDQAKVITETFVFKPQTLCDLDVTKPVYLKQFGAFFGIVEIKTKDKNLAEVKLIKLK